MNSIRSELDLKLDAFQEGNFLGSKINRRQALKAAGGVLGGIALSNLSPLIRTARGAEKLNFLFILTDDQRFDAMSCAGHPFLKTPNLDWIAQTGARFTNAFVTHSLCSPSRACFLTGQYPHLHGVLNNFTPWQENNVTFLEPLKKAGYYTGLIGKWHMPGKGLPDLYGTGKLDRFISFTAMAGQGIYYDCPMIDNGRPIPTKGYIAEVLNDFAIKFFQEAQGRNFCLYLSHKSAHTPFQSPAPFRDKYKNQKLDLPPEYLEKGLDFKYSSLHPASGLLSKSTMEAEMRKYFETIEALDASLGKLFEELDRLKLLDRTVIVFAGDNGHLWGEHRLIDKRFAYEESIRIPFLARGPGLIPNPGALIDEMILNLDLAPTMLDLAEVKIPEAIQGMSFKPLLQNKPIDWRKSWLYEYFYDPPYPAPDIVAVRTKNMKYVRYANNKLPEQMFDLKADPKEMNNLAAKPEDAIKKQALISELERLLKQTGYPEKDAKEKLGLDF